jgi:hypothetical protein
LTYLALGGAPGEPLGDLSIHPIARHTKGNAEGFKAERPALREVPRSAFTPLSTIAALSDWLFGPPQPSAVNVG